MEISNRLGSQQAFGANFLNNKAFREVVAYASETSQLQKLETALNRLDNANKGEILLIHGLTPSNQVYSNFRFGTKTIMNLGAETPAKASFDAIIELGELGRKFRRLVSGNVKENIKPEDLIKKYAIDKTV